MGPGGQRKGKPIVFKTTSGNGPMDSGLQTAQDAQPTKSWTVNSKKKIGTSQKSKTTSNALDEDPVVRFVRRLQAHLPMSSMPQKEIDCSSKQELDKTLNANPVFSGHSKSIEPPDRGGEREEMVLEVDQVSGDNNVLTSEEAAQLAQEEGGTMMCNPNGVEVSTSLELFMPTLPAAREDLSLPRDEGSDMMMA